MSEQSSTGGPEAFFLLRKDNEQAKHTLIFLFLCSKPFNHLLVFDAYKKCLSMKGN